MTEKASISTRRPRLPGIHLTLLLLAASCALLASCSNNSITPAAPTSTPGALATITITASATTLADTNTSETVTASAADSNGVAITGLTLTWTSSNPNVATVNSSLAIVPVAPGFTTISASVGGVTSNTVTLAVTAPLNGQYAFLVQGFDDASGNQVTIIGSFVTDGMGDVTSGVEDINGPPGGVAAFPNVPLPAELSITGGFYGQGTGSGTPQQISFINSNGGTNEFTFSTGTLSAGIPTAGRITEWDDTSGTGSQRAAGVFYLQNTSAFALSSLSGPYAFQFFGQQTTTGSWYVSTGAFTADGNGNLTGTDLDTNTVVGGSSSVHNTGFTATLATNTTTTTDTTSFGQLLVTFTSGISQTGYLYIVSPTEALFMEGDFETASGLEAGQILAQSTPPFSNAFLNSNSVAVEYEQGLGSTAGQPFAAIGLITFSSSGTANFSRDIDDGGTLDMGTTPPAAQTEAATFATVGADGRTVLTGSPENAIIYVVSPNEGFIMSTTATATMGFFQPQSGPFSAGTISGNYFGGTVPPSVKSTQTYTQAGLSKTMGIPVINDAEFSSTGNGSASDTLDISLGGGPINSQLSGEQNAFNLTVSSNGRAVDTASPSDIYYLISPSSFLMLIPDAAGPLPVPQTPVIDVFQQ